MHDPGFVAELLLLIAVAAVGVALFERLRLPSIAGFLVMGALVGPGGLGWVDDPDRVRELAEMGVVFLLFEIGLELPIERVRRLWRRAVVAGGLQIVATLSGVALVAVALGVSPARAFVLGGIVAMSSTALVIRVLSDRGAIDAPQGQLSVGILLLQDLCIVPLLLLVPWLAASEGEGGSSAPLLDLLQPVAALAVFSVLARFGLPFLLDRVLALRSRELFTLVAFLVVVGSAVIAESIGLTLAVGAFVGGLMLSASPYSHQLFAEVVPLRGVLLGLFFTAVGMLLDPKVAIEGWSAVLAYVAGVVIWKAAVVAVVVGVVLGQGFRLGIITGLGLAQTGEFSFVLAGVALNEGLLDPTLHQVFVAGSIMTLIATPFLVASAPRLAAILTRQVGAADEEDEVDPNAATDHVVLLGFGLAGQTLGKVFNTRGVAFRAVEANASTVQAAVKRGDPAIYGDVTRLSLVSRLGVDRARLVVITISDPVATLEAVKVVRDLTETTPILARTRFVADVDALYAAGATRVVAEEFESTLEVLSGSLRSFGIPESAVGHFIRELREEGYEPLRGPGGLIDPWLGEILEEVATQWIEVSETLGSEKTLAELEVRARTGASVLAVERVGETVSNPGPDQAVTAGDRLLAFGSSEAIGRLVRLVGDPD